MTNNAPSQQSPTINHGRHTKTYHNEPQRPFACTLDNGDTILFRTRKGTFSAKVISQREDSLTKTYHFQLTLNGHEPKTAILIRRKNGNADEYLWNVSMRIGSTKRPWIVDTIDVQKANS